MLKLSVVAVALLFTAYPAPSSSFTIAPSHGIYATSAFSRAHTTPLRKSHFVSTCKRSRTLLSPLRMSEAATLPDADMVDHLSFIKNIAAAPVPPDAKRLEAFARILQSQGEDVIPPTKNKGVHPYVIPITKNEISGHVTGLMRSPDTSSEMTVVRSTPEGLELLAPTIDKFIKRAAIEADFYESRYAKEIVKLVQSNGLIIEEGAAKGSKLGLERYLLVNVGAFPDLYEWLANDWLSKGKSEEALITCSRASALMTEWGKMHWVHSRTLEQIGGRDLEARDCARACLQLPLWTSGADIKEVVKAAESTMDKMAASYTKWSQTGGPEEDFVNEGLGPEQIAMGKARYLLDTVCLLPQTTWDTVRDQLADNLEEGSRLDMAKFVRGA